MSAQISKQFLRIRHIAVAKKHIVSIGHYSAYKPMLGNESPLRYEIKTTTVDGLDGNLNLYGQTITIPVTDKENYDKITKYIAENSE